MYKEEVEMRKLDYEQERHMNLTLPPELLSHLPQKLSQEFLQKSYVHAITARACVNVYKPEYDMGVDLCFTRVRIEGKRHTDVGCLPLQCQLKSSKRCHLRGDYI